MFMYLKCKLNVIKFKICFLYILFCKHLAYTYILHVCTFTLSIIAMGFIKYYWDIGPEHGSYMIVGVTLMEMPQKLVVLN